MTTPPFRALLLTLLAGGAAGLSCSGPLTGVDGQRFACRDSSECIEGFVCWGGECVTLEESDELERNRKPEEVPPPEDGGSPPGDTRPPATDAGTCVPSTAAELTCDNALDDDCDGRVDCDDVGCDGQTCGTFGRRCTGVACVCSGNGGASEPSETSCTDGKDNDCDGKVDCDDPNCPACAVGSKCVSSACMPITYVKSNSPQPFIDACLQNVHLDVLVGSDDVATSLTALPFAFNFYGASVTQYWVSSNAVLGFGAPNAGFSYTCPLPRTGNPRPAIFAFMDDLIAFNGACIATVGAAPNRKLVVTWKDATDIMATAAVTVSLVLSETSHLVDIVYQNVSSAGFTPLVGLQNAGGTLGTQHVCGGNAQVAPNSGVRFTPTP